METLKVLLIHDGKPGHMTQTSGLLGYLKKNFFVQNETILIKPVIKIANRVLCHFLNKKSHHAELLFNLFYKSDKLIKELFRPDLIISTGGNTCGANAVLAKKYGCKNLFLGSLRGHDPQLFSGVITTTSMRGVDNAIVLDVSPTLIDQTTLKAAAQKFVKAHHIPHNQELWVMLIGGEGSGYSYSAEDYKCVVSSMLDLAQKYNIRWLLTTSRRTGLENEKLIQSLLQGSDRVAYAVYFNQKPDKIMQAFLGLGEKIFCTEDSTSMVSEAVVSGKPVITLRGTTKNINQGHLAVIRRFARQKFIHRVALDDLDSLSPEQIENEVIDVEKSYDQILQLIRGI